LETIATVSRDDISAVRNLGANTVIDHGTQRFENVVRDADAVIDLVGGEIQTRSFEVLRRGGKMVSAVSRPDQDLATRYGVEASFFLVNVTNKYLRRSPASSMMENYDKSWGSITPGRCARGPSHAGAHAASAEREDRARRRNELIGQTSWLHSIGGQARNSRRNAIMITRNISNAVIIPDSLLAKRGYRHPARAFHRSALQSFDPGLSVRG
jgi:hypothetical protein